MKKRVLLLASVASMIDQFNMPNIRLLQSMDFDVEVACNFDNGGNASNEKIAILKQTLAEMGVLYHQIDFSRSVAKVAANFRAYRQVRQILASKQFAFVHCHSPIGGIVGRLAGRGTKTKVMYTAHGYHFCKGVPMINWLLYYPVEKLLAHFTDILITINQEDLSLAKRKMKPKKLAYIPGVGIDADRFSSIEIDRTAKRADLGVPSDAIMLLSVGELYNRKNHAVIIRALARLKNPLLHYYIAGKGADGEKLQKLSRNLGVEDQVHLLGFRTDTAELYKAADIFCFPSLREGLGIAALEAMAAGLPIITSNRHGIVDYSKNGVTGFTCNPTDVDGFAKAIQTLAADKSLRETYGEQCVAIAKKFDLRNVTGIMAELYSEV